MPDLPAATHPIGLNAFLSFEIELQTPTATTAFGSPGSCPRVLYCVQQGMRPDGIWRMRDVDGCNLQSISDMVSLVEAAAQSPSNTLPWSPPRLNVHAH